MIGGNEMISVLSKEINGLPVLELVSENKQNEALPLVIFYHGWTGCKEQVLTQGYELAKQNLRVILPDALYHGQRQVGNVLAHQFEFWQIVVNSVKEFPQIVEYYRKLNLIKNQQIGVSGLSMGGITTCALFSVYDWISAAVCLEGSPCPIQFAKLLIETMPGIENIAPEYINKQLEQLASIDLSHNPQKIAKRPLHFWHGTADEMVPYQPTKDFYDCIKEHSYAQNVTFTTTPGAKHKVSYETTLEMAEKFAKYFK